ncbi:chromosome segregation protein SMC [Rhodobacteraceae bacterium]|nr:chromosome segregation protein SMC [Paracoccaceae bacterium]
MRFSRLRLNGFKSFVDPTDLIIQDGLTGVVGPNGCGKSNLLEALRWVMGENRPSAMRGGGMEDVIFAGTHSRTARNFADVTLQIDNRERLAPAGFNETDTLEITRRITRDAGSAYKVNTKDVRARDVQMLFADASTGAHSPALVRQGQINELINAKPKARRRILEEAAGISGLYQRRHEAELRLKATEQNLARVDDVIDQLSSQLNTLARQARQASKYRKLGEDLRHTEGMLLYRRWLEADHSRLEAEAALQAIMTSAAGAEHAARDAANARNAQEEKLPPLREEEAIARAIVQRLGLAQDQLESQQIQARDQIASLTARIAQLDRDMLREAELNRDAGETIARLEAEHEDLTHAHNGHAEVLDTANDAAESAAEVLEDREATFAELTEEVAALAARHQSAERQLADTRAQAEKAQRATAGARHSATEAEGLLDDMSQRLRAAQELHDTASHTAQGAEEALQHAETRRAEIQGEEDAARTARAEAEGACATLRAEERALARVVEREAASGSQILDGISVLKGYEAALGAALADDLGAPALEGNATTGWATLPDYPTDQPLPDGVKSLAEVVDAPPALARRLSQIGLVADWETGVALHMALARGQRLVTIQGDLWRWDGYRTGAGDTPSASARRLQQRNRLDELRTELEALEATSRRAIATHTALKQKLDEATHAEAGARTARKDADRRMAEAQRALTKTEAERSQTQGRLDTARDAMQRHEDEALSAREALDAAQLAQSRLPDLKTAREDLDAVRITVEAARMTMMTRRSSLDEIRRDGQARVNRLHTITKELDGWRGRLATAERQRTDLLSRREDAARALEDAAALPEELADRATDLDEQTETAKARAATATEALHAAEAALSAAQNAERETERQAGDIRETRARAEAKVEAARDALRIAVDWIRDETERTPPDLLRLLRVEVEDIPVVPKLETAVYELKRQRDALGAVNLRAEEDARTVQEEHDTLFTEKGDLEDAIAKLRGGIAGLNREGRERLLAAFEQVNENFGQLFTHLFGGGEARLALVESDDPLDAGLEIMCQPPGKKLSTLSLLSGGEQTLTAMALIFAVFMANPAPICVLDEVDAPLDDANVTRFCDLLDEMTRRGDTRFLVITHHAVTMSRMNRLFGVTMQEQGVSQLVSVDLKKAEAMVA